MDMDVGLRVHTGPIQNRKHDVLHRLAVGLPKCKEPRIRRAAGGRGWPQAAAGDRRRLQVAAGDRRWPQPQEEKEEEEQQQQQQ